MKRFVTLLFACIFALTAAGQEPPPRTLILDGRALADNRARLNAGDATLQKALDRLRKEADRALQAGPYSVMDKATAPPSGDKHDYYSVGPYWWPDPDKPDGLPYIRKDGKTNPERHKTGDAQRFKDMQDAVTTLATAWYFTRHEPYAEHAAKLLRAWYLDPATRMNPNMDYAQAIPGRTDGRGIGIVDAWNQPAVIDAVALLSTSNAWTDKDQAGMVAWFKQLLDWLQNSKNGKEEDNTRNNHATQYDVQLVSYALFVGDDATASRVLNAAGKRRIATQIEPDGTQPHELKRTRSWGYSCFNLKHFAHLAALGRHAEVDPWAYDQDGRSIPRAIDALLPYALGEKKWKHKQIRRFDPQALLPALLLAAGQDEQGRYRQAARALLKPDDIQHLLYAKP